MRRTAGSGPARAPARPAWAAIRRTPARAASSVPGLSGGMAARSAVASLTRGGQPLPPGLRRSFEPRFGRDLSHIRLHSDPATGQAAQGIGARAYVYGDHIGFGPGELRPDLCAGRRLIAHEIAHTMQPGRTTTLRRTCPGDPARIPPGDDAAFETAADQIRALDAYRTLPARATRTADRIIDGARASACPMYYITLLRTLFDTPRNPPRRTRTEMRAASIAAVAAEQQRLQDPVAAAQQGAQEATTRATARRWRRATGPDGTAYRIDDSDLTRVHVHMKVRLYPRGGGRQADVDRTRALEDGIEAEAGTAGYSLDIEFVRRSGPDVFEVGVNPERWVTADNWVGDVRGLAHEAHHLLGLEDRYDYTVHARNRNMGLGDRLHWFREQMVRAADPLSDQSMMEGGGAVAAMNEQDVCALTSGDFRACLITRYALRPAAQIERIAAGLSQPYHPRHGALLQVLAGAWMRRPWTETTAGCARGDPLCGLPPARVFHDSNITAMDAARFPLANPHRQPAGTTLTRRARTRP